MFWNSYEKVTKELRKKKIRKKLCKPDEPTWPRPIQPSPSTHAAHLPFWALKKKQGEKVDLVHRSLDPTVHDDLNLSQWGINRALRCVVQIITILSDGIMMILSKSS